MKNNSTIKYYLYARKSSENEDRQVQSIDDQINKLKECANNLNLRVSKVFKEAKSAKEPGKRPIFEEMIDKVEKGKAQGILTWQINRLSRNPVESGRIQWLLQQGFIKSIQTIDRNYLPGDNAILFSVESGMANQYILDLRKNVKRGLRSKIEKGWYPQLAPLGYLNDKEEHTIVKDPDKFDLVRKMWDLMLTGKYSPLHIQRIANEDWGFRTRKFKRMGGKKLSRSYIYKIFNNPFYMGKMLIKGTEYKGKHPPMVNPEEFEIVQYLLGRRARGKASKHNFPYTGFIRCGECGCLYTAQTNKKLIKSSGKIRKYSYYFCTRKKKDIICSQRKSIREDRLEEMIDEELKKYTILPEFRDWALDVLHDLHEKEIRDRNKIYKTRVNTKKKIQRSIDNLVDMRIREQITDEEYNLKRDTLLKDKEKIEEGLTETNKRTDNWLKLTERAFDFIANLRMVFAEGSNQTKKNILMSLGKSITITDGVLNIEPNDWLVPIKENYPALEAEYLRFKPSGEAAYDGKKAVLESVCESWLGREDSNL